MENTQFSEKLDLTNCDKEPIHIPGRIQSHGFLLVCDIKKLKILQISINTDKFIDIDYKDLLNKPLSSIIDEYEINTIKGCIEKNDFSSINPRQISINNKNLNMALNISKGLLIIEFEPVLTESENVYSKFYNSINSSLSKIQSSNNINQLFEITAEQVKIISGYDRVMIYRFDKNWNGEVVAEAKNDNLESYYGLHYPHTDIPAQARELYLKNWIRLITDINEPQAEIFPVLNPENNQPLDLSNTLLRATSPIHIEYLKNMGVCGTLTISIIFNNKLWGLFACHNYSPRFIDYHLRNTCELIGKVFSSHLSLKELDQDSKYIEKINNNVDQIISQMSEDWDLISGMANGKVSLLDINDASGAVLVNENKIIRVGVTPSDPEIKQIIEWLNNNTNDFYYSDEFPLAFEEAKNFKDKASGLMSITISKKLGEYVIWFKPEVIQTVNWGGNPNEKNVVDESSYIRLSPRKSFEKWSQQVNNKSLPWKESEILGAKKLKENIINVVIHNAEQIRSLNRILETQKKSLVEKNTELEHFAHIASHDLKEPLRMIMSYNQLLKRRYKDQLDESANEFIDYSIQGAGRLESLINDLLQYTKVGLDKNSFQYNDMNKILKDVFTNLKLLIEETSAKIEYENLPTIVVEKSLIIQLLQNIISNSLKYRNGSPKIKITSEENESDWLFCVTDNGIGIDSQYFDKIFVMFKRLHSKSKYDGTGVGLATCKKIVESHNGNIWVESEEGKGSSFYFTISKNIELNP